MKVELISWTGYPDKQHGIDLMIFTKNTRLNMTPGGLEEISNWPMNKKLDELAYMAKTIPSSWEFFDFTWLITDVSRAFTHQFVRNRTGSYAQQSMRVVDMNGWDYHTPEKIEEGSEKGLRIYRMAMNQIASAYDELKGLGVNLEDARGILPTNVLTNIVAKFNLRTMSDLCRSRLGMRTQEEHREVVRLMYDTIIKKWPPFQQFLDPRMKIAVSEIEDVARKIDKDLATRLMKVADIARKER